MNNPDASAQRERSDDSVRVVGSGFGWSLRSTEQALLAGIKGASHEILVCAYHLNAGASDIWDALSISVVRGVSCVVVCNDLTNQTSAKAMLRRLVAAGGDHVQVYECPESPTSRGLHAKVLVADRRYAVIGSANLSFRGLNAAHEMGVVIEGPGAGAAANAVTQLVHSRFSKRWTN